MAALQALRLDLLGELILAAVLGGLIGWDREAGGKPAGLRTNMLICIGSTLIADMSVAFSQIETPGPLGGDPARLVAQVVSGIGFLGAGTIIQARGNVTGLTTAATLWVVAAIGIGVGAGHYVEAAGTTILVLVTLVPLGMLEDHLKYKRRGRNVRLVVDRSPEVVEAVERAFTDEGFRIGASAVERETDTRLTVYLEVRGDEEKFQEIRRGLVGRPDVHAVRAD